MSSWMSAPHSLYAQDKATDHYEHITMDSEYEEIEQHDKVKIENMYQTYYSILDSTQDTQILNIMIMYINN